MANELEDLPFILTRKGVHIAVVCTQYDTETPAPEKLCTHEIKTVSTEGLPMCETVIHPDDWRFLKKAQPKPDKKKRGK